MDISKLIALSAGLLSACTSVNGTNRPGLLPPLAGAGGELVPMATLSSSQEATVLVWWSTSCPCVRRYEGRIADVAARYPAERVLVRAVSSNADDDAAEVARVAAERGFSVPVLQDPGGRLAQALGVKTTPTVVVLDRTGAVRYRGWIDNERLPGEPDRSAWLDDALAGLLAGRTDFETRSPTWGCPITRSLGEQVPECCRAHVPAAPEHTP
jgi:hypothetical protein